MAKRYITDCIAPNIVFEALAYDPEIGTFRWMWRPLYHFKNRRSQQIYNANSVGKQAGTPNGFGYISIGLSGKIYLAHRLAWAYMTKTWPDDFIDHIDGNRSNNAWKNLRAATNSENLHNRGAQINGTSGFKGVSWSVNRQAWWAQINVDRVHHNLGYFDTPEAAHAAYSEAAIRLHGRFARPV